MTRPERALQIWQVLLSLAHNRQTITYESLAKLIGMGSGTLAQPLTLIMNYCKKSLPPITVLVVQKKSGRPGEGLITVEELNSDREKVYNYSWYKLIPLTVSDLK